MQRSLRHSELPRAAGALGRWRLRLSLAVVAIAVIAVVVTGDVGFATTTIQTVPLKATSADARRAASAWETVDVLPPVVTATSAPLSLRTLATTPSSTRISTLPLAPRTFGVLNLNPPDGYVFDGGGATSTAGTLTLGNDCTISGVNFTGGDSGIEITGSGNKIQNCTFGAYTWAALLVMVGNDNVIDGCTFNGTPGSGANIQILGGQGDQITDNIIHGGVTAIAFLYSRSVNGGGAASLITGNVVSGNTCSGFTEEGITFDIIGDRPADVACLEYDTVKSVSGSTVTLSALPFPNYVGYDMVFLTGPLAGSTRSIVGQSGASFTLSSGGAAVGDQAVIGACFKGNLISNNTVTAPTGSNAIILYGMAFGNTIQNNTVLQGTIKVESLDNLVPASGSATKTYGRAPCGFNTIQNNVVAGDISLEYYAIPSMNGHANTYPAYTSFGNSVIGNMCVRVEAERQVCNVSGNSAMSNVTLKVSGLKGGALKLGKSVTATGMVTPNGLAGGTVTLTVQLKKGTGWVSTKTVQATIGPTGTYSWRYRPAMKGAYRVQAAITDAVTNMPAMTPWFMFKVQAAATTA